MDETELSRLPIDSSWPSKGVMSLTSDIVHERAEQYLAELMLVIREPSLLNIKKCWSLEKYKESYIGFMMQILERLKHCDFKILHNAILKHKLTSFKDQADTLIAEEIRKVIS